MARLAHLTDSAPVDKINFIRCYAAAREEGLSKKNIESGFRVTGNWPISRRKALCHPEIQQDKGNRAPINRPMTPPTNVEEEISAPLETPTTSRQIKDFGKNEPPAVRRKFQKSAKAYEDKALEGVFKDERIRELEAQSERLQPKRRKKIPNPNRTWMTLAECLARGLDPNVEDLYEVIDLENEAIQDPVAEDNGEEGEAEEELEEELPGPVCTRSGRAVQRPSRYSD